MPKQTVIIKKEIIYNGKYCGDNDFCCTRNDFWDSGKCTLFNEWLIMESRDDNICNIVRCYGCLNATNDE